MNLKTDPITGELRQLAMLPQAVVKVFETVAWDDASSLDEHFSHIGPGRQRGNRSEIRRQFACQRFEKGNSVSGEGGGDGKRSRPRR
jgi:hypothetical protein